MNSLFSVTSPSSDLSLLSIAELRTAVGAIDGSQDAALSTLGKGVSASIARQCGIASDGVNPPTLLRETCTEVFRVEKSVAKLVMARRPVTSVVSVVVGDETLDAADYEINTATGSLIRLVDDVQTDWLRGKITVVYQAGYGTAPDDLKLAATKLATALSAETARDPSLKREEIPGVMTQEFWVSPSDDPLLSKEIADLLSPYVERFV